MKNTFLTILSVFLLISTNNIFSQCFSVQTFNNGGQSTFTIPGTAAESYLIEIEATGADGGDFLWGSNPQTDGGSGANMKGSFVVPGGSDLLVVVGSSGMDAPGSPGGGGGGGGSAVIIDNTDVLIAAGAGGGGGQGASNTGQGGQANTNSPPVGGAGLGSSGGGGFNAPGGNGPASTGGGAGTLNGQGIGGTGGVTAGSGGAGFGGGGGGSGTVGGGGGGYKGGDGSDGSSDLNGKGGDSYVNTLYSGAVIFNTPGIDGGGANNDGIVIITCIPQSDVEISLVSAIDPLCFGGFGGSIEVSATGGLTPYMYSLNGGTYGDSPVFTGLSAGNYTVTVQDGTGATDMLSVTLISPPQIVGEILSVTHNVCFGASEGIIEVIATGGTSANNTYGYSVNGSPVQNSGTFNNLPNGFYVISFFDDNLCNVQLTTTITSPDDIDLIVISKTDVTCPGMNDGSIAVEAFGGSGDYMYALDDGPFDSSPQFFDLAGGTYVITVMDEEECTEDIIVFISEPEAVNFDLMATDISCFGESDGIIKVINLIGTAPFQFKLNGGEASMDSIFTDLTSGNYDVTVIDSSGCETIQSAEISGPDSLILNVTVVMEVQCGGDSTGAVQLELLNGTGEITYSVNQTFNFTGFFGNLGTGEYTASATDENGCSTEVNFVIQESATFTLSIGSATEVECFGGTEGSVVINVTDGIQPIQYTINGIDYQDSPQFSGLAAGDYEVEVMDSTGCVNTIGFSISEPSQLEIDYLNIENVACFGDASGSIAISASGGAPTYTLNGTISFNENDTITLNSLIAGVYVLEIEDTNGCLQLDTLTIIQNDSLQLFIDTIVADSCGMKATGFVDLNAVGGYAPLTFLLNGESNLSGVFDSLSSGTIMASVVDTLGCSTSIEFLLPEILGLSVDSVIVQNVSCNGYADGFIELFISETEGEVTYYVNDVMDSDGILDSLSAGVYEIVAMDEGGCFIALEIEILEPDPLVIEVLYANLYDGFITVGAGGGTLPYKYSIDGKVTYQDSATFTGLDLTDYTITVIDANGCESSVIYIFVSVEDLDFEGLSVYPNPTNENLYIEYKEMNSELVIEVISNTGQLVKQFNHENYSISSGTIEVPLSGIGAGSYVLRLRDDERNAYKRIVVIK